MEQSNTPEIVGLFDAGIVILKECEAKLAELAKSLPYKVQPHFLGTFNTTFIGAVQRIYANSTLVRDLPTHRKNEAVFAQQHLAGFLANSEALVLFDQAASELAQLEAQHEDQARELDVIQSALIAKGEDGARSTKALPKDAKVKEARGNKLKELIDRAKVRIAELREWIKANAEKVAEIIKRAQDAGEKVWDFVQKQFKNANTALEIIQKIADADLAPAPIAPEITVGAADNLPTVTE